MVTLDASKAKPIEGGASFSTGHRAFRALWNVTWLLFASWTPPFLRGWRIFLLRIFGARIAATANVRSSARVWYPPYLLMEDYASLGPKVICYNMAQITIKRGAVVSQRAHLCAGSHDIDDPNFQLIARPIFIGERAWVAAGAFVGPGVTIGKGAVLGAQAVIFKDIPEWNVFAGNPAVFLKVRAKFPIGTSSY